VSLFDTVRELVSPGSVRHRSLRPMEAGLRPDSRLDDAVLLTEPGAFEPECVAVLGGSVVFSQGSAVHRLDPGAPPRPLVELGGEVAALAVDGATLVASVVGRGVVRVDAGGAVSEISTDTRLRTGLTDLCVGDGGRIFATQGSDSLPFDRMIDALMRDDRSGSVLEIPARASAGGSVRVLAERQPWPSGIASNGPDRLLVALAHAHTLATMGTDGRGRSTVQADLPFYPGRLTRAGDAGFWLAVPYVRNRATELILDEPELRAEMVASIARSEWLVPRLRSETPHTDALQMGQLRMLGVLKPWAPPRSYGLVAHLDAHGRFDRSAHSRPDQRNHGITHAVEHDGRLVMAMRGRRAVAAIEIGRMA
jgi:hypothetical protein